MYLYCFKGSLHLTECVYVIICLKLKLKPICLIDFILLPLLATVWGLRLIVTGLPEKYCDWLSIIDKIHVGIVAYIGAGYDDVSCDCLDHTCIINNNKFVSYFLPVLLFSDLVYGSIPIQYLCDTSGIQNHVTCDNSVGSRKRWWSQPSGPFVMSNSSFASRAWRPTQE